MIRGLDSQRKELGSEEAEFDSPSNSSVETSGHLGGPRGTAGSYAGPLAANAMATEPQAADEAAERLPQTVEPVVEQQAAMESWATVEATAAGRWHRAAGCQ